MVKLEKYTGLKTYMYPNGAMADKAQVLKDYPAALTFAFVVQTDPAGEVMMGFYNLSMLKAKYGIDASLPEAEAIAAIEEIMNTPVEVVETDATTAALENIAAQLEFQNLMAMDDAGVE